MTGRSARRLWSLDTERIAEASLSAGQHSTDFNGGRNPQSRSRKGKTMKHVTVLALLATGLGLTGCHTVNGVGKDVKSAGTAVSKASGQDKKN